jgi:hypothetical protein
MSTRYFAILDYRATRDEPAGLARRRRTSDGTITEVHDETLTKQGDWVPTALLAAWDRAESSADFAEISDAEAARLVPRLLATWS